MHSPPPCIVWFNMLMQFISRFDRLSLVAYLTLAGAAVAGLWQIDRILLRWLAMGLLAAFGLLHSRLPEHDDSPGSRRLANLIIACQAGLVVALIETTGIAFPFIFLFFILSVTVMLHNPLRLGMVWLGGFVLLTGWFFFEQEGLGGGLRAMAIYAAGYLFFGVVTNALMQARLSQRQNALLLAELQAKNRRLEEYAAQVETLAAVEERNRLAREMHDTIGHRLTTAAVQLEAANFQEATGLPVHLELPEDACKLTPAQRLALYRTAQEGLTNIQRHAAAQQAWLRLQCSPEGIALQVIDDGAGMVDDMAAGGHAGPPVQDAAGSETGNGLPGSPLPVGFGLRGLQERAAQLRGAITLSERPGGGTILAIQLPIEGDEA